MLKNFAMMGVGCREGGHIYVTDMGFYRKIQFKSTISISFMGYGVSIVIY